MLCDLCSEHLPLHSLNAGGFWLLVCFSCDYLSLLGNTLETEERQTMGFFDKLAKAIDEVQKQSKAGSGKFTFQEEGANPKRDISNRVIVEVKSGKSIIFGVNKEDASDTAVALLLGKPEAGKEIEEKSVRLRIARDLESPYPNSVKVESIKGDLVGWVLKNDAPLAVQIIDSLTSQVRAIAPEIRTLVLDVGAKVHGGFSEEWDGEGDEDEATIVPELDDIQIHIKDPAEIDILSGV